MKVLNSINLRFKSDLRVPHNLIAEDKIKGKDTSLSLLKNLRIDNFPDRIMVRSKKYAYHNNASGKGKRLAPIESASSVSSRTLNNKKMFLCIWWNCHGNNNKEYLKSRQIKNSKMLTEVRDVNHEKQRRFEERCFSFHQDKAQPRVSIMVGQTLYKLV